MDLARVHAVDLDSAHVLARGIRHTPDLGLASLFGLGSVASLEPVVPLPGLLGVPLRWVADGPLASTLLQVLASSGSAQGDPYLAFAQALASRAEVQDTARLRADLGRPLTGRLRELAETVARKNGRSPDDDRPTVLARLTEACTPMCTAHQPPGPAEAAALRAVALGLADTGGTLGGDAGGVLRAVAATVTVAGNRSKGEAKAGESIILALV
jgi:hypothetical protein